MDLFWVCLCWTKRCVPFKDLRNILVWGIFITKSFSFLMKQDHVVSQCKNTWCFLVWNDSGEIKENCARSIERRKDLSLSRGDNCILSIQTRQNWSISGNPPVFKMSPQKKKTLTVYGQFENVGMKQSDWYIQKPTLQVEVLKKM